MTFGLKVAKKVLPLKFSLEAIADIVFDLRNEFHANRMSFRILGIKSFLGQFDPPPWTKNRKFWSKLVFKS
jgi:hypothetical protein